MMPVCITGMHRTGTSMITRMLNLCGLYLGNEADLMPAAIDNPEGFWENVHFVRINEEILLNLKAGWDAPPFLEPGWEKSERLDQYRQAAKEFLKEMGHHSPWGWKDPRNSLTLPFWQQLIPDLKVVICLRNPYEVALSLSRRGSSSHAFAMRLWYEYYKRLLTAVPQQDRIITHYDASFYDCKAELHRLLSFLNMSPDDQYVEAACKTVRQSQKHQKASPADLSNFDAYPDVKDMYSSLCAQAGPVYELALHAESDKPIITQFEAMANEELDGTELATEQIIRDLRERVVRSSSIIRSKEQTIQAKEQIIQAKEQTIQSKEQVIRSLNSTLQEIYGSNAWKLVQWLRKFRLLFIPRGSFREKAGYKIFAGLRKSKSLYVEFMRKFTQRIKSSRISKIIVEGFARWSNIRLAKKVDRLYKNPVLAAPTVSIIIPVHNQIELTLNCLLSIIASQDQTDYEVIVVDDASTDQTPDLLKGIKGIRYIQNLTNQGFVISCNHGAQEANGEYLVFLNNDTRVHKYWLDNLYETFSLVPNTGLAGSKLIYPTGKLQEAGGVIWADGSGKNYGRYDDPQKCIYNYVREVDYVSGASMMISKRLWESLGGFDLKYQPAYYEDADLAFKVQRAGYKVIYQPFSVVTHYEGSSNGVDLTTGVKQFQLVNRKKFFDTWRNEISSHGSPAKTADHVQRNRSSKARVLYIDDVTLKPDRNAGAVLSECYLAALREDGYAVTFLPHFDLRYNENYTRALQKKGIECIYLPCVRSSKEFIKQEGHCFKYVIISRASVAAQVFGLVKEFAPQAKVIFNTIDLHFMRLDRAAQLTGEKNDLEAARKIADVEMDIIRKADCTLVVSDVEAKLLSDLLPDSKVRVVPFPADVVEPLNGYAGRNKIVYLGGFKHTPNVDAVLYFVKEIWPLIIQRLPNAQFIIAGPDAPAEVRGFADPSIVVRGFVENLDDLFATAKLSVAPIRYGAGIKGKVLTSLGYGVPCVTTSIGAEGIGLTDGENILIADTPVAFADATIRAFTSPETWNLLSKNGLDFIRQNYTRSTVASRLLDVFRDL